MRENEAWTVALVDLRDLVENVLEPLAVPCVQVTPFAEEPGYGCRCKQHVGELAPRSGWLEAVVDLAELGQVVAAREGDDLVSDRSQKVRDPVSAQQIDERSAVDSGPLDVGEVVNVFHVERRH